VKDDTSSTVGIPDVSCHNAGDTVFSLVYIFIKQFFVIFIRKYGS